jgi:diaminohydroxyphosphoribosylaminopyrimidine deaminase/5-amino-6-(5-phosphoribosylamino)uracil reductase
LKKSDEKFMKEALKQARRGLGRTSPNPVVGAVIVRDGDIIASGYHKRAGSHHAEIEALRKIEGEVKGGDSLYVTLEPCNHYGKTPPCTEAVIRSGLKRVFIGMGDPNPNVSGSGSQFLEENGIEVKTGLLESECRRLNEAYIKFITTGRPFVLAKSAMTMDGWTATSIGHSQWITNENSRRFVHGLRDKVDGVLVGVGTVLADDPSLTTRLKNRQGKDPVRIIVDTQLRTPPTSKVINHDSPSKTFIAVGEDVSPDLLNGVDRDGVSTIICPTKNSRIDLDALLGILGGMSITSLLVEGGSDIMGSMIRERLIDKFYIFKAPKILGGGDGTPMASGSGVKRIDRCLTLKDIEVKRFKNDTLLIGYPE